GGGGSPARLAEGGGLSPLSVRHHRAVVAALRQDGERRSATATRPPGQASGPAHADEPHRTPPAARALALAPRRPDRRTKGGACGRIRAHRRAYLRGEAQCPAPAARHHVDGRALEHPPAISGMTIRREVIPAAAIVTF